jgi:hypothetical protein
MTKQLKKLSVLTAAVAALGFSLQANAGLHDGEDASGVQSITEVSSPAEPGMQGRASYAGRSFSTGEDASGFQSLGELTEHSSPAPANRSELKGFGWAGEEASGVQSIRDVTG